MASINYYLKQNTTSTAEEAPYTIQVVPNGVYAGNDFLDEVAKDCTLTSGMLKSILNALKSVSESKAAEGYACDLGFMKVSPKVYGTVDYIDTPYNPVTQCYQVQTFGVNSLASATNDLIPVRIAADEISNTIRISNVMDVATEQFGVLIGSNNAILTGNGLTMDQAGEYLKLLDKKTLEVKATCVIGTCSKGQRVTFHLPAGASIASGDYYLEIATKGLVALEQPNIYRKPVKFVYVAPPVPSMTKVYINTMPDIGEQMGRGDTLNGLDGLALDNVTSLKFVYVDGSETIEDTATIVSKEATKITFKLPETTTEEILGHLHAYYAGSTTPVVSSFTCKVLMS